MLRIAPLCLAFPLLSGCGSVRSASAPADAGPVESPVLFAASRAGSLFVASVRADTGEVTPFGPALPAAADAYSIGNMEISSDGARVAVVINPKVGSPNWTSGQSVLVTGDGSAWTTLTTDTSLSLDLQGASDDLSLLVVMHACPPSSGSSGYGTSVVRFDGTSVFEDMTCSPGHPGPFVYAVAPDGSYFVLQGPDGTLTLHGLDGHSSELGSPADEAIVGRTFATSLIGGSATSTGPWWVDTTGAPVDVPNWSACVSTPTGLCVVDGSIYELSDRSMKELVAAPAGLNPTTIMGVSGAFVVVRPPSTTAASYSAETDVIDAEGAVVARYVPKSPTSAPHASTGIPNVVALLETASSTSHGAWQLQSIAYETVPSTGEGFDIYERADDLFVYVDGAGAATGTTVTLRRAATDASGASAAWPPREYVASPSGTRLLFSDSGAMHVFDIASATDAVLTSDLTFDPGVNVVRHAVEPGQQAF